MPFVALNMALIVNHYGRYHRHDPDFMLHARLEVVMHHTGNLKAAKVICDVFARIST